MESCSAQYKLLKESSVIPEGVTIYKILVRPVCKYKSFVLQTCVSETAQRLKLSEIPIDSIAIVMLEFLEFDECIME